MTTVLRTNSNSYTVYDYLQAWKGKKIRVNQNYQRSEKVWKDTARSYLIETVLMNYPIPKLALHLVDDGKAPPYKDIVDGQQRSTALRDFFNNKFALADVVERKELVGKFYKNLSPDEQRRFRTYQLGVDEFLEANEDQIREVFRRINSYTVPLNHEEQRHAEYQGVFKWFINSLRPLCGNELTALGVFTEHAVVRMNDAKLLSELCHAILYGITGTKRSDLDEMYKTFEEEFPKKKVVETRITEALYELKGWKWVSSLSLAKPHHVYALLLAITHVKQPLSTLNKLFKSSAGLQAEPIIRRNLEELSAALEAEPPAARHRKFVGASVTGTNGKTYREIRFQTFCKALTQKSL